MSGTEIKIGVVVDDGGSTGKLTSAASLLKKGYDEATASVGKMNAAVKATAAPSGGSKTMSALQSASRSPQESIEYGQARAAVGTGAAGRDFAQQAQGLGGLVHVYATFAANLFAVSAAFTALRDAANTENMVKGLDQLGAASGRSLGALSKQIVETTGGALSLRDAMGAVAQASSAGLGNKQINDIAIVATKASNALGISMTDAISRLSRGISKIEPELLDELGIFVKVDEATNKYALSVGKTVGSLSDFEKRQAFANAVLEQGKQKFAAIEAAPNPYDKLLASVSNLATAGLELVNKVLNPVIQLLASSPTSLGIVFAGIAGLLLKQAIPAISNWRSELVKSAEVSAKTAKASYENFRDYSIAKALEKEGRLVGPLQSKLYKDMADAQSTLADTMSKKSKILAQAMTAGADPEKMARLTDTEVARRQTLLDKIKQTAAEDKTASDAKKQAYDDTIKKQEKEIANIQVANSLYKESIKTQSKIGEVQTTTENKKPGIMERMLGSISTRQENTSISKGILAQVGADTQTKGLSDAWKALRENVKLGIPVFDESGKVIDRSTKGLEGLKAATTLAKGGFLIMGSAIGTALSALSPWLELIGLVVAGFHILDSVLSKSAKEQEDFNSKLSTNDSAIKTVTDTFDLYTKKSNNAFSIEAISAYTTALGGVSDSLDSQLLSLQKFNEIAGDWDKLKDSFGTSNLDKLQKNTVQSIKAVVKTLELSGNSQSSKGILAKALFGQDADASAILGDTKELSKAFDGLTKSEREEKIKGIADAIGAIRREEEYSTNAAKAFIESLSAVDKLVDQMIQANAFTDLQGKLGVELVQASDKLAQALMDPLKALEDIAKLGQDPKALAVLNSVDLDSLKKAAEYTRQLNDANKEIAKATSDLEKAKSGSGPLATTTAKDNSLSTILSGVQGVVATQPIKIQQDISKAESAAQKARDRLDSLKKEGADFALSQTKLITEIADAGFQKIETGLRRAKELADIALNRTALSVASSLGADTSSEEYKLKLQEISIQKSLIEASYDAQIAVNKNTEELSYLNATIQKSAADAVKSKESSTADEKATAEIMSKAAQRTIASISAKRALSDSSNTETEVTKLYGKEAVLSAKSLIKTQELPGIQKESATAMANSQAASALIEKQSKELEFQAKKIADKNTIEKESLNIQQEGLSLASQLNSYSSISLIDSKSVLQQKSLELDVETKIAKIKSDQSRLDLDKVKNSISSKEYDRLSNLNTQRLNNIAADKEVKTLAIDINNIRDKGAAAQAKISAEQAIKTEKSRIDSTLEEAKISSLQKQLDIKLQLNLIDEQTANREKGKLELDSQSIKNTQEKLRLESDRLAKEAALDTAKNLVNSLGSTEALSPKQGQALSQAMTSQANAQAQLDNAKQAIDVNTKVNDITVKSIADNTLLNQKLIEQKDHLASIASLTENLSTVFGDFGKTLGGVISAFDTLATNDKRRAAALADEKEGTEAYNKLKSKQARAELDDQANVAGQAKKLFKEKTLAFKTLDGLQKISSAQSIAISIKEFALKSGLLKQEQIEELAASAKSLAIRASDALASIGIDIPAIYAKYMSIMGPFGAPAAAAAIAAFVGGAFGGGGSSYSGPTGEESQKVQGTGQVYNSAGNLVDTGTGVFGGSSEKLDSINKSLDLIAATSVKGLDYDNKMLTAFINVSNAITGAAQQIYSIPGLRQGTNFGTSTGTTSGSAGGISGFLDTIGSTLTGGVLGGIGSALFGGKTSVTASIDAAGIQLKGSFQDIIDDTSKNIIQYKDILKQFNKSGGLFGSSRSWTERVRETQTLDGQVSEAVADIFRNAKDMFSTVGEYSGVTAQQVDSAFRSMSASIDINLKGLTGDEVLKELNASVSVKLNEVSASLFGAFTAYKKFGEDLLTTVVRVTDTNIKINQLMMNLGSLSPSLIGVFNITEALAKAAGGLDKFITQATYFSENFYTEAERAIPTQKALIKQLAAMGLSSIDTKAKLRTLVQSLDLTTDSGQKTYQSLMELAPGFVEVTDAVFNSLSKTKDSLQSTVSSFSDFSKNIKIFKDSLLLSNSSIATPLEKYAESKLQYESTLSQALAGDKDAMGRVTGLAQTFLENSKVVNASSEAYQTDFNSVLDTLDNASINANASVSVAQLQLNALDSHTSILTDISSNIAIIAGVPAKASGGRASGLTLVGEMGPELVDFTMPARVYTADQTAGMFTASSSSLGMNQSMGAMVTELQQLRQEVSQLRKDQQKQTGDLIISNYDANQKASSEVAAAVTTSTQQADWALRSKPVIS